MKNCSIQKETDDEKDDKSESFDEGLE